MTRPFPHDTTLDGCEEPREPLPERDPDDARQQRIDDALMIKRPDHREPVQQPGEDWIAFSYRWDCSRFAFIRRHQADRLNAVLGPLHAAENAGKHSALQF